MVRVLYKKKKKKNDHTADVPPLKMKSESVVLIIDSSGRGPGLVVVQINNE